MKWAPKMVGLGINQLSRLGYNLQNSDSQLSSICPDFIHFLTHPLGKDPCAPSSPT
jgi:hypothetical protein